MGRTCFLCGEMEKRLFASIEMKLPHSKRPIETVLQHFATMLKTKLVFQSRVTICADCYRDLKEYDNLMVCLQESETRLTRRLRDTLTQNTSKSFRLSVENPNGIKVEANSSSLVAANNTSIPASLIDQINEEFQMNEECDLDEEQAAYEQECRWETESKSLINCSYCTLTFQNRKDWVAHNNSIHNKTCCELCTFTHRNEDHVRLHMNTHEGYAMTQCRFCTQTFTTRMNTMKHMETHYDDKKYQCDMCGICFAQATVMNHHKLQHREPVAEPIHQCPQCTQVFKSKRTLTKHQVIHDPVRERYGCEYCEKTFSAKYSLTVHRRTHPEVAAAEGLVQIEAEECVATSPSLTADTAEGATTSIVAMEEELTRHTCVICNESFAMKDHLTKHMVRIHDVIMDVEPSDPKKACHVCGQLFSNNFYLDNHLTSMHGIELK